jgi:hypothetical protein
VTWQTGAHTLAPGAIGSDAVLKATFAVEVMRAVKVEARLENHGTGEIFVFDRLWTLDSSSRQAPDREGAYRFVRDGTLRLLLGPCPLPRRWQVTYRNVPHASLVPPGGSLALAISSAGPVGEHGAYFPEPPGSATTKVHVERVELVVQYAEAPRDLAAAPSGLFPGAFVLPAAALDGLRSAVAPSPRVELDVLRRADDFDRLTLPGEKPEPLQQR